MKRPPVHAGQLPLLLLSASLLSCGCELRSEAGTIAVTRPAEIEMPSIEAGEIKPVPAVSSPDVLKLIASYNSRNTGAPALRRVRLELESGGEAARAYTVVNLWRVMRGHTETLFLLEEPQGLRGTSYLLTEDHNATSSNDATVHLFLPAGNRKPMEVNESNLDEGLLGSDFSYCDLRMLMPTHGYSYRLAGESVLLDEPVWVIEARPAGPNAMKKHAWRAARFYLAKRFQMILGADYLGEEGIEQEQLIAFKKMRVQAIAEIDGIWTATKITMQGMNNGSSVLKLEAIDYRVKIRDEEIFLPERLPELSERIHRDSLLESLLRS